jgi:hypothetical protein
MNDFIAAQKQLNQDDASTLDTIRAQATGPQAATALVLQAWNVAAKKDLLSAQAAAAQTQPAQIVASLAVTPTVPAQLDDGGAGSSLQKANSAFATIAKPPGTAAQLKDLFDSAAAVNQALEALKASAPNTTKPTPPATAKPAS